jgi:hypothetical protein
LGLLLAAPTLLETWRLALGAGSVVLPGWQFGWLGSPLLLLQTGLVGFVLLLFWSGWLRGRETLALTLTAVALALAGPLFSPKGLAILPENHFVTFLSRHQAVSGALPSGAEALERERWTGAQGGMAPKSSLVRWRLLSVLGTQDPDALSLANAGWLDNGAPQPWQQPVSAAVVDSAEGPDAVLTTGTSLFQRPLRLAHVEPGPGRGSAWHLFTPTQLAPGCWQVDLGHSPPSGAWAFLSESYDWGWSARSLAPGAKDTSLPVAETQGSFLAAALNGGEGLIQWRYRPPSLVFGLFLAFLGILGWIWAAGGRVPRFGR